MCKILAYKTKMGELSLKKISGRNEIEFKTQNIRTTEIGFTRNDLRACLIQQWKEEYILSLILLRILFVLYTVHAQDNEEKLTSV